MIGVVPDQACPGCGAYWGHPDEDLDYPNRIKVDDWWKCYNPDCEVGYYEPNRRLAELAGGGTVPYEDLEFR